MTRTRNRKLLEAKRAGSAVGVIEALLDEYHNDGIRQIQVANDMQAFGKAKLDAVQVVVRVLDQYKVGNTVNLEHFLPQILRDFEEKHAELEKTDITQMELLSQKIIQSILRNTRGLQ